MSIISNEITSAQEEALEKIGCTFYNPSPFAIYVKFDVDSVIDYLRKKHNVIIYNSMEPFVDPRTKKILYRFSVKFCNMRDGWNGREYIGRSTLTCDIYSAKRQAIWLAIRWINKQRNGKKKLSARSTHHSKRKNISTNKA